jgi:hypothetical protein
MKNFMKALAAWSLPLVACGLKLVACRLNLFTRNFGTCSLKLVACSLTLEAGGNGQPRGMRSWRIVI